MSRSTLVATLVASFGLIVGLDGALVAVLASAHRPFVAPLAGSVCGLIPLIVAGLVLQGRLPACAAKAAR